MSFDISQEKDRPPYRKPWVAPRQGGYAPASEVENPQPPKGPASVCGGRWNCDLPSGHNMGKADIPENHRNAVVTVCRCKHDKSSHGSGGCNSLYYGSGCETHVCTCRRFMPAVALPTEPTWGIVRCLYQTGYKLIYAGLDDRGYRFGNLVVANIVDFIPISLTKEEIDRINTPV